VTAPASHAAPPVWQGRARELFRPARHRPVRPAGVLLAVLAVLAGTACSLVRQPGAGALDTVWAEDGQIFLAGAVNLPFPEALTSSYAGYFHTGPRLLAELAAATPAGWAAAVLAAAAAAVTAGLAVLVYVASAAHLPSRVARVVAAAIVVVPPLAQEDVPNSIANLHWPALYALFWVLLWTPAGWPGRAAAVATTALVTTSDILVIALLPLAVVRLAVRRDRYSAVLAGVLGSGLAVQVLGLLTGASERDTDLNPVRAAAGYLLRAVPGALAGSRWLGTDHTSVRWLALAAVAWLLVGLAVLAALRGLTRPAWTLAAVAAVHSVGLYVLPVLLSGVATQRYALAPAMLVVVALLALLPPEPGRAGRAGLALVVLLAVVCAVNLRVPNLRAEGPSWSGELDRAREVCAETGANAVTTLRLPPVDTAWQAELPCIYLD
jgi:hypothetical protein